MKNVMLDDMNLNELKRLKRDVEKAIETFEERRISEARAALEDHAKKLGVTLNSVVGGRKKNKPANQSPVKYRHPEDPTLTWTGKGRKPKWFIEATSDGKSPQDLEIS